MRLHTNKVCHELHRQRHHSLVQNKVCIRIDAWKRILILNSINMNIEQEYRENKLLSTNTILIFMSMFIYEIIKSELKFICW